MRLATMLRGNAKWKHIKLGDAYGHALGKMAAHEMLLNNAFMALVCGRARCIEDR
jgi:hypothetical protein